MIKSRVDVSKEHQTLRLKLANLCKSLCELLKFSLVTHVDKKQLTKIIKFRASF